MKKTITNAIYVAEIEVQTLCGAIIVVSDLTTNAETAKKQAFFRAEMLMKTLGIESVNANLTIECNDEYFDGDEFEFCLFEKECSYA